MGKSIKRTYVVDDADYVDGMLNMLASAYNCTKSAVFAKMFDSFLPNNMLKGIAKRVAREDVTILSSIADICSCYAGSVGVGNDRYKDGDKVYTLVCTHICDDDRIIKGNEADYPMLIDKCWALRKDYKELDLFPAIDLLHAGDARIPQYFMTDIMDALGARWSVISNHNYTYRILYAIAKIADENRKKKGKLDDWADKYDYLQQLKDF